MNMTRMLRFGMASAALFAVFSVSAAEGPVLKVPALARLEIAAAELKPAPAGAGHAADLKVTVRNSGAGVAAPFGIVVSYQGRALQHLKWPGLGAGAQDTRTARLALPPAGGPICVQVGLANVIGAATKQACMTLAGVAVQRSVVPGIPAFPPQTSGKPGSGEKLTLAGRKKVVHFEQGTGPNAARERRCLWPGRILHAHCRSRW